MHDLSASQDLLAVASIRKVMGERGEDVKKKEEEYSCKRKINKFILENPPPTLTFLIVRSFAGMCSACFNYGGQNDNCTLNRIEQ